MKLVSLVNSGESLEKTISLITMAYSSNYNFYSSFDEVIVFYSPNIMKSKNDFKTVGTVKSILEVGILKLLYNCEKLDDLFTIKNIILNNLLRCKKITYRQKEKLQNNKNLFLKLITNMSWLEVFPELENLIIENISGKYKNLRIISMSSSYNLMDIIPILPSFQDFGKIYFYDYNGSTIMKKVNKVSNYNLLHSIEQNSIYFTYNVYVFMLIAFDYVIKSEDVILGYRQMKNTYRKSYTEAINYILKKCSKVMIEPRNINYNNELGNHPFRLGANERGYYATYNIFIQIIKNIFKERL